MEMNRIKSLLGLSFSLAEAGFKEENEGSYLGIFWYLLNPLLTFLLLLAIFHDRLGHSIPSYPLYLLLGVVIFNFFQKVTIESAKLIHNNRWIIKSINFPREALVGSIVLRTIFSHIFEMLVLVIVLLCLKMPVGGLIFYPVIFFFLAMFVFGAALILASVTVYFVDLNNIWVFVSRLIWLGTPIFYAIEGQTRLFVLNLFNPLYYFITIARDLIVYAKMPESWMILGAMGYSLLFLVVGLSIFNKLKIKFAEMI